jgi:hypothetical protein
MMIMDEDESLSGIFSVVKGEIDPATRFPFAESEGLSVFYIETIPLSQTKYKTMSGYELWHKRMSHAPIQAIKATIPHSKGLHELEGAPMEHDTNCPACMIGIWKGPIATVPEIQGACKVASRAGIHGYHDVIGHFT